MTVRNKNNSKPCNDLGQVEIYDIQGNLVKKESLQTGLQKINLSNLTSSLYLVKINDPQGKPLKSIKLILE